MIDRYELIRQTPVPVEDLLEWARKWETMDRRVASTKLFGMCLVSTVFLGVDHSCGGRPLLFETMAFWDGEGGDEQLRCSTWPQAEQQHARMCAECVRPRAVLAYMRRLLQDRWYQAKRDLGRRWREIRGIERTDDENQLDEMGCIFDLQEEW